MNSEQEAKVRLFGLNTLAMEAAIRSAAASTDYDFGHGPKEQGVIDEKYFPQFDERLRRESETMAAHYRVFYCLESSIRTLVTQVMVEAYGETWWDQKVPDIIRNHVNGTMRKEQEAGVSQRSEEPIDYTTFGELGEIIKSNWLNFTDVFQNLKALEKVIATLNVLRGPIAHCKPLAEDEVLRLHLSVRDWFRAMG